MNNNYRYVSDCCGANVDEEKPFKKHKYDDGDCEILSGICSKCEKESDFHNKTKLVVSKHYE